MRQPVLHISKVGKLDRIWLAPRGDTGIRTNGRTGITEPHIVIVKLQFSWPCEGRARRSAAFKYVSARFTILSNRPTFPHAITPHTR